MDAERFDVLTRALDGGSRRRFLMSLSGAALGALTPLLGLADAEAKNKKKKRKFCSNLGDQPCGGAIGVKGCCQTITKDHGPCCNNTLCCYGTDTVCCGRYCCPPPSVCCGNNQCCQPGLVCCGTICKDPGTC